ncbi:MAG: T9SS type A sorting domain-containing protein [Bacteroidaceae bacterium]|nr:T9SS type A sorting domain-containing protein [Bacteroidaceae bacterium]
MKKRLQNIMFMVMMGMTLSVAPSYAQDVKSGVETEQQAISIQMKGGSSVVIKNAENLVVEIFSLTGEKVYTAKIDSSSKQIELDNLAKGYYIVKINKIARKIYLK